MAVKRRWHPGLGDTRSRDRADIRLSEKRADLVLRRVASHDADGLNEWLVSVGVNGWGMGDASEALAIIKRELGTDAWRRALDVVVMV
jgi:hypothetical protein